MSKRMEDDTPTRREFLKLTTASAPAAAAAAIMAPAAAEASDEATESGRMRDTAHTRAYFDSARF